MSYRYPKDGKNYEEIKDRVKNFKKSNFDFSLDRTFASMFTETLGLGKENHLKFIESKSENHSNQLSTKKMEKDIQKAVKELINADFMKFISVGGANKEIISDCMNKTDYLIDLMEEEYFSLIIEPPMSIASFESEKSKVLLEKCDERDWYISKKMHTFGSKFVVIPHVSSKFIERKVKLLGELT